MTGQPGDWHRGGLGTLWKRQEEAEEAEEERSGVTPASVTSTRQLRRAGKTYSFSGFFYFQSRRKEP